MASRFWVGGTGTWDNATTTHWSATSGGGGGASVPGSGDSVTFDANSGGGTVTPNYNMTVLSITMGAFTGTLDFSINNNSPSMGSFSGTGTGTRTLKLGSGTWTISGTSSTPWNLGTTTNLTFDAGTSTILFTAGVNGTGAATMSGGGLTYYNVSITGNARHALSSVSVVNNLSFTGNDANATEILEVNSSMTVNGTFTITGAAQNDRILVKGGGGIRTITAAAVALTNVDFQDIIGAGAASWTGTSIGNWRGNTGITFTAAVTRYWVGGTGNWSDNANHWAATTNGSPGASMPLGQDTARFDASSFTAGSQVVTLDGSSSRTIWWAIGTLDWTGVTNTPTLAWSSCRDFQVSDKLTFVAGMAITATAASNFLTIGYGATSTVLVDGQSQLVPDTEISAAGQTVQLTSNFAVRTQSGQGYFYFDNFTIFDANDFNITANYFNLFVVAAGTMKMGNGNWTARGAFNLDTAWDIATVGGNLTLDPEGSTLILDTTNTTTSASFDTFRGGGHTYNKIKIQGSGTTPVINWNNTNNTFAIFEVDNSGTPKTIKFTAGTTQTITSPGGWIVNGSAGNLITFASRTPGSAFTLTSAVAEHKVSTYLSLQDSTAAGSSAWYAGKTSTNVSGNTGWIFADPMTVTVQAKARVKVAGNDKTIQSKARVKVLAQTKTVQSKARLKFLANDKTVSAKSRLKLAGNDKTVQAKARVKVFGQTKTVQAKARIKIVNITKTVDARGRIKLNVSKTAQAKAYVVSVGKVVLSAPADQASQGTPVSFEWIIPTNRWGANLNFYFQVDQTDNTFGDLEVEKRSWQDSGFEYWNGSAWVALPITGVAMSFAGNLARYITSLSAGDKFWRVKAFAG